MAVAIVIALRLVLPLSILRWPLAGGLLAMAIDAFDVVLVEGLARVFGESPEFGPLYPQIDKWLDTYYLSLELVVTRRWTDALLRRTALVLFAWRIAGVVLFELTSIRQVLVVFPNLFENFYLYVLIMARVAPRLVPRTARQLVLVLVVLYIPKAIQEWVLHAEQLRPWQWIRDTILRPWLEGGEASRSARPNPRGS
jgi:hypothetical protein